MRTFKEIVDDFILVIDEMYEFSDSEVHCKEMPEEERAKLREKLRSLKDEAREYNQAHAR